jgi:hypothetical protein
MYSVLVALLIGHGGQSMSIELFVVGAITIGILAIKVMNRPAEIAIFLLKLSMHFSYFFYLYA